MIFIAIAGPSGAGKTTLANFLKANFDDQFEHIRQDDYLNDPDTFPMKGKFRNWEHPSNYKFDVLADHLRRLQRGESVLSRSFAWRDDDALHEFYLVPQRYVLVDGSLVLTNEDLASLFDVKIYLDVSPEVTLARREERARKHNLDVAEYDREVTIPEFERHGLVQKLHAEYIVDGTMTPKDVAFRVREIITKRDPGSHLAPERGSESERKL